MKSLLLTMSFLALSFSALAAENVTGRVTITLMPTSGGRGGVVETDLRQVGNKILGNSSWIGNIINLTIDNGTYAGPTGPASLTNLKCDANGCSGFINGFGVNFKSTPKTDKKGVSFIETRGMVNNNVYSSQYNENRLKVSSWNSLDVKKVQEGKYQGQAGLGLGIYAVTIKTSGSLSNFLADPALVAIFLGAAISHHADLVSAPSFPRDEFARRHR